LNRSIYHEYCTTKLAALAAQIEVCGKLNLLHLHVHSENFYMHLLNLLFGHSLENANVQKRNVEGLDLVDLPQGLAIQVSATATKAKIDSALSKDFTSHPIHSFQFVAISKDASPLRSKNYVNPSNLKFDPANDIHDVTSILQAIMVLEISHQEEVYHFIKRELGGEISVPRLHSHLTTVILDLANSEFEDTPAANANPFEIEKKIAYNSLNAARMLIEEHSPHYAKVEEIYKLFDRMGAPKSRSVFNSIQRIFAERSIALKGDDLFFATIDGVIDKVMTSANFDHDVNGDDLSLAATILVVHAFVKCKVFDRPSSVAHAAS
jgi:SMEK domain-containing protein/ABC-3C protein